MGKVNDIQLVSVKQLSSMLSLSQKTLYRLVEHGQIPHLIINNCIRFDLTEIREVWLPKFHVKARSSDSRVELERFIERRNQVKKGNGNSGY